VAKEINFPTFQLYNLSTRDLVLRQNDLGKHSIPERRGVTHRSEAEGEQKMFLYAQHVYAKLRNNIVIMQA